MYTPVEVAWMSLCVVVIVTSLGVLMSIMFQLGIRKGFTLIREAQNKAMDEALAQKYPATMTAAEIAEKNAERWA